jgi:chemosensory pili system protein ChpA (sensor histidine kinase/response regulator)
VRLDITGGAIEIDRGVLERMAGPFEHLLRNSVAHGIESPEARRGRGQGRRRNVVSVTVAQSGNEVAVEFADDGAGLDLARIREPGGGARCARRRRRPATPSWPQLIFKPGLQHRRHGHRTGRPRRRPGRGARRSQRDGRPH